MKTELLYLEDTYQFTGEATFVEMRENERGTAVILNQTIFYPQGGGQPTDIGTIKTSSAEFEVSFVGLDPDGVVWHFGEFKTGSFEAGESVALEVDSDKRSLHARIHSAGHLIDCALQDIAPDIKADKGFHFVDGSYVEGEGVLPESEQFKDELEQKVNEIVDADLLTGVKNLAEAEAKEMGFVAPPGKSVRIVWFGEYKPAGCGGTHVESSKAVGKITITKAKSKKGRTKISYKLQ